MIGPNNERISLSGKVEQVAENPFQVNKVIVLSDQQFQNYKLNPTPGIPYQFIHENRHLMGEGPGQRKECLLVVPERYGTGGVLVCGDQLFYVDEHWSVERTRGTPVEFHSLVPAADVRLPLPAQKENTITEAPFMFAPSSYYDLVDYENDNPMMEFKIVKGILLDEKDYENLNDDISMDHSYLMDNFEAIQSDYSDENKIPCVLVSDYPNSKKGLLISYDYVNGTPIAAPVEDINRLDLQGVMMKQGKDWICTARLAPNPGNIEGITYDKSGEGRIQVEQAILLAESEYSDFAANLDKPYPFLAEYADKLYYDPFRKESHVVLVKPVNGEKGIVAAANHNGQITMAGEIHNCDRLRIMGMENKHIYSYDAKREAKPGKVRPKRIQHQR